jgi:hypothetical protein
MGDIVVVVCVNADDKKLSGVLKKMALQPINGVEEVNIFINTGEVIHIKAPKSKRRCNYNSLSLLNCYCCLSSFSPRICSFQHLCHQRQC